MLSSVLRLDFHGLEWFDIRLCGKRIALIIGLYLRLEKIVELANYVGVWLSRHWNRIFVK